MPRKLLISLMFLLITPLTATAAPTQDEVLKSINKSVDSPDDSGKILPFLAAAAGLVILLAVIHNRRQQRVRPKTLNHVGRLMKEISRGVHLRPQEMRQLRLLADEQSARNPVTLLLCPSVLHKAMLTRNPRIDRKALAGLAKRFALPVETTPDPSPDPAITEREALLSAGDEP